MQLKIFSEKAESEKKSNFYEKICWQFKIVMILLSSTRESGEREGPWKLNNDESKEPDKIQKSFIWVLVSKEIQKAVIANESVRKSESFWN